MQYVAKKLARRHAGPGPPTALITRRGGRDVEDVAFQGAIQRQPYRRGDGLTSVHENGQRRGDQRHDRKDDHYPNTGRDTRRAPMSLGFKHRARRRQCAVASWARVASAGEDASRAPNEGARKSFRSPLNEEPKTTSSRSQHRPICLLLSRITVVEQQEANWSTTRSAPCLRNREAKIPIPRAGVRALKNLTPEPWRRALAQNGSLSEESE